MNANRFTNWADVFDEEAQYYDHIAARLLRDPATERHFGFQYIQEKIKEYRQKAERCRETAAAYRERASNC